MFMISDVLYNPTPDMDTDSYCPGWGYRTGQIIMSDVIRAMYYLKKGDCAGLYLRLIKISLHNKR